MSEVLRSAIKGAAAGAIAGLGYAAADRPAEGLLATGLGAIAGATAGAMKHHALNGDQFGGKKFSDAHMDKINQWHNDIGK